MKSFFGFQTPCPNCDYGSDGMHDQCKDDQFEYGKWDMEVI